MSYISIGAGAAAAFRRRWPMALCSAFVWACGDPNADPSGPVLTTPPGPPVRLVIAPIEVTIFPEDTAQVSATAVDRVGRNTGARALWATSDSTVARVNPADGTITALALGTATITAMVDTLRASSSVTVIELPGTVAFSRLESQGLPLDRRKDAIVLRRGAKATVLQDPGGHALVEPDLAPDGSSLVAHIVTRYVGDSGYGPEWASDLFVIQPDLVSSLGAWRQLTRDGVSRSAAWSPDGRRIAYVSGPLSKSHIYIIDAAGGTPVRLTQREGWYLGPRWSPDGGRLAFIETHLDEIGDAYVVNADGSGFVRVSPDHEYAYGSPSWSPDGKHLLVYTWREYAYGLYLVDVETRDFTALLSFRAAEWSTGQTWSPDGRLILYSVTSPDGNGSGIYIMNADGSQPRQLTRPPSGSLDMSPTWRR